jgi:hypothetical protein
MGTGSGTDLSNVYTVVMKDSFDVAMNLMHDVVRNPAFAPEEIDRQKQQAMSSLQVNSGDPDYVASVLFDRLVYGFHPYGVSNTAESIGSITRADLQAFHRQWFVPNNMVLAVVGDVTTTEAFAMAEKVFGGWARGTLPGAAPQEPPPPTRRIVVIDKPDASMPAAAAARKTVADVMRARAPPGSVRAAAHNPSSMGATTSFAPTAKPARAPAARRRTGDGGAADGACATISHREARTKTASVLSCIVLPTSAWKAAPNAAVKAASTPAAAAGPAGAPGSMATVLRGPHTSPRP